MFIKLKLTSKIMDGLKTNIGTIGVGLAAAAIAGFLIYKIKGSDATPAEDIPESTTEELPNFYFIDSNLSQEEKEAAISEWVKK